MCRTGPHPRRSIVSLRNPCDGAAGGKPTHAWITTAAIPRSVEDILHDDTSKRSGSNVRLGEGQSILCFGFLHLETRGRWYKRLLPTKVTPTALLYVPTTRSIVMACQDSHSSDDSYSSIEEGTPVGPRKASTRAKDGHTNNAVSNLRIFSAHTLEEREGEAVYLQPELRITNISRIGVDVSNKLLLRASSRKDYDERGTESSSKKSKSTTCGVDTRLKSKEGATAAVGGDVIAVACCRHADNGGGDFNTAGQGERCPSMKKQAGVSTSNSCDGGTTTTVLATFEVVACGSDRGCRRGEQACRRCVSWRRRRRSE